MAYIRVKRGKFKVEINKKGYPRVFKSFSTIKDAKKFAKDVESQMERQIFEDYSGARGINLKEILTKYRDEKKKRENESISVTESPDDIRITKKELQMLIKIEGKFRERMLKVEQGFLRDPRTENKKLAKDIKKSYKDNVTKFMREVVGMIKRMK